MEIAIGLWILSGILSAVIASGKERSGCAHFALGFILGPLWLIAVLAMGKAGVACPHCREVVNAEATVCPHCRRDIPREAGATEAKGFKNCPACHRPARPHMLACPACGESLVGVPVTP